MDNSTPVFWIWIGAVILFAAAVTAAYHFARKAWRRVAKRKVRRDDVCVTRHQFAEVFGDQSAAAGASDLGEAESHGGSSAQEANPDTDTTTDTATQTATSTQSIPAPANDNAPVTDAPAGDAPDTLLVEDPSEQTV